MKKDFIVNSGNSPLIIPVPVQSSTSFVFTPDSADYSVEYSCTSKGKTPNWVPDTEITAVTTQQSVEYGKITMIRVTLNSGTSVAVDFL